MIDSEARHDPRKGVIKEELEMERDAFHRRQPYQPVALGMQCLDSLDEPERRYADLASVCFAHLVGRRELRSGLTPLTDPESGTG